MGLIVSTSIVSAFGGHFTDNNFDHRRSMMQAIDSNDYETWKEIVASESQFARMHEFRSQNLEHMATNEDCPFSEMMNSENLDMFRAMNSARQSGDYGTAKELANELKPARG